VAFSWDELEQRFTIGETGFEGEILVEWMPASAHWRRSDLCQPHPLHPDQRASVGQPDVPEKCQNRKCCISGVEPTPDLLLSTIPIVRSACSSFGGIDTQKFERRRLFELARRIAGISMVLVVT
jgi:hypothetical protein